MQKLLETFLHSQKKEREREREREIERERKREREKRRHMKDSSATDTSSSPLKSDGKKATEEDDLKPDDFEIDKYYKILIYIYIYFF